MILDIINFFNNFFVQNVLSIIQSVLGNLPSGGGILPPNVASFLKSSISTFVPYTAIIHCITMQFPILVLNTAFKLLLRAKSFVPTMGGK